MSGGGRTPRPAAAREVAAETLARARRARQAREKVERLKRRQRRARLGTLADRTLQPRTLSRYWKQVKEFFVWAEHTGHSVPDTVLELDTVLCSWAEHLWGEGDPKGILNGALCGLAHYCPAVRGSFPGAWRLYKAWGRCERPLQAPPLTKMAMRALAGWFQRRGYKSAATLIVLAFQHLLRTNEFMAIVNSDVVRDGGHMLIVLRDTKMGKRLGVNQEVLVKSRWLAKRVEEARHAVVPGLPLLGVSPSTFRRLWKQAHPCTCAIRVVYES